MSKKPDEPQFRTDNGWVVARVRGRDLQHVYRVLCRGQHVGWVIHYTDGWRWEVNWSPGTATRAPQFSKTRTSKRPYPEWKTAVSQIARTDVGRLISKGDGPAGHDWNRALSVRGEPWVPKPAAPACDEDRQG